MTERKPPGMTFTSWIDKQINEAAERGAFENLPGAGKPLPKRPENDDGQAWLHDYARREGVPVEEMLPTPLKLRRQAALLTETVRGLRDEQAVRDVVAELNDRIMEWRKLPLGPPIFVPLVDAEAILGEWRDAQAALVPADPAERSQRSRQPRGARPRWWHRGSARRGGGGRSPL